MVIILEGIDRVGKTTLANKIKDNLSNSEIFKAERIENKFCTLKENNAISYGYCMGQVQLFNNTYAQDKDRHIIIDRFHWTEYVYTKSQRDANLDKYYLRNIEKEMLKQRDGYLVILMMPINLNVCSKMHGSDLSLHQKLFEEVYKESNLLKYKCTYSSDDMAIKAVHKFIDGKYTKQGEWNG